MYESTGISGIPTILLITFILICYTAELTVFGGVLQGFMKKTEDLAFNQKNLKGSIVEESAQALQGFKRVQRAFEPLLFIRFTCQSVVMTTLMYCLVNSLRRPGVTLDHIIFLIMKIGFYVLCAFMTLIYESVLADDAYAAMRSLLIPLG